MNAPPPNIPPPPNPRDPPQLGQLLDSLQSDEHETAKAHDKAILTLAGAALTLSLAFTKDLVPFGSAQCLWALIASWVAFVLALTLNIFGFLYVLWNTPANKQMTFDVFRHRKVEFSVMNRKVVRDARVIFFANIGQGLTFLLGMALLTFYVIYNVKFGQATAWERWAEHWAHP